MTNEQALLEEFKSHPDDTNLQAALIDLLLELDREEGWQRALDAVPDCHRIREEFGQWLERRGDGRGWGFRALRVHSFSLWPSRESPKLRFCWWDWSRFRDALFTSLPGPGLNNGELPGDWYKEIETPEDSNCDRKQYRLPHEGYYGGAQDTH